MKFYRVFADIGWVAVDVPAANRAEAVAMVREKLARLLHRECPGIRISSLFIAEGHTRELSPTEGEGNLAVPRQCRIQLRQRGQAPDLAPVEPRGPSA